MKMIKFIIKHLGLYWTISVNGKEFVENQSNGVIHHHTCVWCDNITSIKRLTKNQVLNEIKVDSSKIGICCKQWA